jgi:o-succinylbenzoate synthase
MLDKSALSIESKSYFLNFIQPGGTSRGVLHQKESVFLKVTDHATGKVAWGECGILRKLSMDDRPGFEETIGELCASPESFLQDIHETFLEWPSIRFGLEMALQELENDRPAMYFPSAFTRGEAGIKINGLIWMNPLEVMIEQLKQKIATGYSCIKIKIGAINWEEELSLLQSIRKQFNSDEIEIRVDANGAFKAGDEVRNRLDALAKLDIHSIEQPIAVKQWEEMQDLCKNTPVPIALDEELIGVLKESEQKALLDQIQPQYIILKPSLLGGFQATSQWIDLAKKRNIGYWITSCLESNIGLNAIAQYTYGQNIKMPQGLGTGSLYDNNIPSPLYLEGEYIRYDEAGDWDYSLLRGR